MTIIINSVFDIADRYDAVLCDVWGVIHNGRQAYPAACAALQRLRSVGTHVILITNVPKPRGPIPAQLDRAGVPRDAWGAIVTSGDAIRAELAARAPGPITVARCATPSPTAGPCAAQVAPPNAL